MTWSVYPGLQTVEEKELRLKYKHINSNKAIEWQYKFRLLIIILLSRGCGFVVRGRHAYCCQYSHLYLGICHTCVWCVTKLQESNFERAVLTFKVAVKIDTYY